MSHQIIKSRGEPLSIQPITPAPIARSVVPEAIAPQRINWEERIEKMYVFSVIGFLITLTVVGAIGVGAIGIFGVIQLGKMSVQEAVD